MAGAARRLIYYREVSQPKQPSNTTNSGNSLAWIRESVRSRGWLGALRYYTAESVELLRDLSPSRRRSRYGDIDFDFDHGVDTTWATVPLRTRIRELLSGARYQPSEPSLFHQILQGLPIALGGFTFIDLGSGKGRTLLMASAYPFRRIVGVELLPELDAIARRNIARYHSDEQKCFALESHAGDARGFAFPAEPAVLYLFNPFPEPVLRTVLTNLRNSLTDFPRPVYVLYHNLVHEGVFAERAWLQPIGRTPQYAIYCTRTA
jgi:SAM-dependent methyltransferase